jgi:hypothetical protein
MLIRLPLFAAPAKALSSKSDQVCRFAALVYNARPARQQAGFSPAFHVSR